jgi:hypothetical protein
LLRRVTCPRRGSRHTRGVRPSTRIWPGVSAAGRGRRRGDCYWGSRCPGPVMPSGPDRRAVGCLRPASSSPGRACRLGLCITADGQTPDRRRYGASPRSPPGLTRQSCRGSHGRSCTRPMWSVARSGPPQRTGTAGALLSAHGCNLRRRDHFARGSGRLSKLGLPLCLGPRRLVYYRGPVGPRRARTRPMSSSTT